MSRSHFVAHHKFLHGILKQANRYKRQVMLENANKEQINAVSEMVLNLLGGKIPVSRPVYKSLKKKTTKLRELGSRQTSLKKRKTILLNQLKSKQKGASILWKGLTNCYNVCCSGRRR